MRTASMAVPLADGHSAASAMPRVVIVVLGTQGDVQPCVALGAGLRRAGCRVAIATSAHFSTMVRGAGLVFHPLTGDFHAMMQSDPGVAEHAHDLGRMARLFRRRFTEWSAHWPDEGRTAVDGATLVIGVGLGTLLAKALSEARGIAFVSAQLQPLTPSRQQPPMMASGVRVRLPSWVNAGLYHAMRLAVWSVYRPAIDGIVRPALGLPPYPWYGPYFEPRGGAPRTPVLYGFSRHVLPPPSDWPAHVHVCGYWHLTAPEWRPPEALADFLAAGPPPVYAGFGSMIGPDAATFTRTLLDGMTRSGERVVLATGWGGLSADGIDADLVDAGRVFVLDQAPHDWLLPRMAMAFHHGGAGTAAAAARAGIPSVVVPFFGDQPFWARCLQRQGVAPAPLDRRRFDAADVASAIAQARTPVMRAAARGLGERLRAEDGVGEAIACLRRWRCLPEPGAHREARAITTLQSANEDAPVVRA